MRWIELIKSLGVICLSSLLAFSIVEYSYRFILGNSSDNTYSNRTMLFQAGNNFLNNKGYFKYFPNSEIRSLTLYSKPEPKVIDDLVIEYDYLIRTNNAGLVMQSNLSHNDSVFL